MPYRIGQVKALNINALRHHKMGKTLSIKTDEDLG